ncbi:MAG: response regulator [Phycisphaerae bacterium]|jgi:excisionase family DNA binding protein|nr:response regulator [Phycisphaerae bacterium]
MREQPFMSEKDVLTTGEVAKICNVASRTVSKWFDSGQLKGYRIPGSKDRRIPVSNLLAFMRKHNIPMDGLMSGNPRVLVVDGDREVGETLKRVLNEQTNYDVRVVATAFAAGVECERFRPHVMLLDVHLGENEANSLTAMVRSSEDLQLTRIIGMSAKITDGQATQLLGRGFDSILRKPFSVRQVIESIEGVHAVV